MIPRATYRLQFRDGMDFDRAVGIVPYLQRLGISHLYASPIFSATSGSTHGYDVTDHNQVDPVLGGREGLERLSAALGQAELGLILDIVPNHMAASVENPWWRDVLQWGELSRYARHFDIDWRERLTLPILGQPFDDALAAGELALAVDPDHGGLALKYFEQYLPLTPASYDRVLSGTDDPHAASLVAWAEAQREAGLGSEGASPPDVSAGSETRLGALLAERSRDRMMIADVHSAQPWKLVHWKEARKHLTYRRFFEVTGLVGVRVEDPLVFRDVHALALDLVKSGTVDGLRVDHVDGLADPKAYLGNLRTAAGPDAYLTVEKILCGDEQLPVDWAIEGTTGYEFIPSMAGLFTDRGKEEALQQAYAAQGGCTDLEAERLSVKRKIISHNFDTELSAVTRLARDLAGRLLGSDMPESTIRSVIVALASALPVYRTYGDATGMGPGDADLLRSVAAKVRTGRADVPAQGLETVLSLLIGDFPGPAEAAAEFRVRLQQLTGPVMAKSVEDTLFYRYNRLIAVNEVGCDPAEVPASLDDIHARLSGEHSAHRAGLLATATHDTKRGEDARARLYAISEMPEIWNEAIRRWREMNTPSVALLADGQAPEPETEWLLYQALAGIWPGEAGIPDRQSLAALSDRFQAYVEKALREAKSRTDWADVNEPYETAVKAYAARLLSPDNHAFVADFAATLNPVIRLGAISSLAQTLIKLTAPGVPDIYQGTEGEDLSLVDPDNRRAVDFGELSQTLSDFSDRPIADALADGCAKQQVIARVLDFRAQHPSLFEQGDYTPVITTGARASHVFAFMRRHEDRAVLVVVPRLLGELVGAGKPFNDPEFWLDTAIRLPGELAQSTSVCVLTGARLQGRDSLPVGAILAEIPVAILSLG